MADTTDFHRLAMAMPGTTNSPHFDRRAYRARLNFATLGADGLTGNLRLTPEDQEFRCSAIPRGFAPVPGGWGRMGWTTVTLASVSMDELASAIEAAWRRGSAPAARRKR